MLMLAVLVVMVARIGENVTANSRISGLINNFLADFSQAKLIASSENRYVAITFSADGFSYTISKQTDITDPTTWTLVKTVRPFSDRTFFSAGGVSDFAVNSTGEVRPLPIDLTQSPSSATLRFFIRKGRGLSTDAIAYNRTIQILPYGGLKVEKN
jgi:hypothetical protein